MAEKKYIAVDLGAESGRVMLSTVSNEKLALQEIHRFVNDPVRIGQSLRWDFPKILSEIKVGIKQAVQEAKGEVSCIGVDSWGVDFGLLDENGQLLENPCHYRDSRTDGIMEKAFGIIGKRTIYEQTGIECMQINTLYQLLSMRQSDDPIFNQAKTLLFTADLFAYFLCGKPYAEYSLASTSQLMDMKTGRWAKDIFRKLHLPLDIMPSVVQPGTIVGHLTKEMADELGCLPIPVAAVGSHDTASAVAAVPASSNSHWAYLSCGTWSLLGVELPVPVINEQTFEYQLTNEGGVNGTIRLLKNIMGLWLVQECKRQWQNEGQGYSYGELTEMAVQAKQFTAYIDPGYSDFLSPGRMSEKIAGYLKKTGQSAIEDKGTLIRSILESLALNYAKALKQIADITGTVIDCLHIVGGGTQNKLLCQFTANAAGKKVLAGPVEATASGNILMQAKATGHVVDMDQIRRIIRNSFDIKEYLPSDQDIWKKQSEQYQKTA